ncbi:hypothetical protein B5E60_06985 [Alistipes sp. An116]|nr:hypothetical protein B5E60_06985 [Alistipes sp. An116]
MFDGLATGTDTLQHDAVQPAICFVQGGINDLFNDVSSEVILANQQRIDRPGLNRGLTDDHGLKAQYTTDGPHLTEEGYRIWSGVLRQ